MHTVRREPPERRGRELLTLEQLEEMRRRTIAEIKRLEAQLGRTRLRTAEANRSREIVRNLDRRERAKVELAHHTGRLMTINAAIKTGRRVGNLLLLSGSPRPRTERELVAALYRLFTDAVPPKEQTEEQRVVMQIARDYVTVGTLG